MVVLSVQEAIQRVLGNLEELGIPTRRVSHNHDHAPFA
jgi:hypothetical protein